MFRQTSWVRNQIGLDGDGYRMQLHWGVYGKYSM